VAQDFPQSVLFCCDHNSIRSPMAEGLMKKFYGHRAYVQSAGVKSELEIDGFAVAVCAEMGVELERHRVRSFDEMEQWGDDISGFDLIVALSPASQRRALDLTRHFHLDVEYWPILDPAGIGETRRLQAGPRPDREADAGAVRAAGVRRLAPREELAPPSLPVGVEQPGEEGDRPGEPARVDGHLVGVAGSFARRRDGDEVVPRLRQLPMSRVAQSAGAVLGRLEPDADGLAAQRDDAEKPQRDFVIALGPDLRERLAARLELQERCGDEDQRVGPLQQLPDVFDGRG
jgi:arsenate reductase